MPESNDLFDDEPAKPEEPRTPAAGATGSEPAQRGGFTRRRFLVGAGAAAAAGAAVGTGVTVGITSRGGGGSKSAAKTGTSGATGSNGVAAVNGASAPGGSAGNLPVGQPVAQAVVKLNVNGADRLLSIAPHQSLAEVLRQNLGLTGTKVGCDRSECSACTVMVDGVTHNSCSLLAIREEGKKVLTIEGLEQGGQLSPVQQAFMDHMGLQCGFCTPGQIMQATALLQTNPKADEAAIRRAMSGNLCKCAAYPNILAAVQAAQKAIAG